jgi:hypothetical protein
MYLCVTVYVYEYVCVCVCICMMLTSDMEQDLSWEADSRSANQ